MASETSTEEARRNARRVTERYAALLLLGAGGWIVYGWGASGESWFSYLIGGERLWELLWISAIGLVAGGAAGRAQMQWHEESRWTVAVAGWATVMIGLTWWFVVLVQSYADF